MNIMERLLAILNRLHRLNIVMVSILIHTGHLHQHNNHNNTTRDSPR